jgi:anti-sigma factor RsiW
VTHDGVTVAHKLGDRSVRRELLADADNQLSPNRRRELLERLETRTATAAFHPRDGGLRRSHPLGELRLRQRGVGPQPVHKLAKRAAPTALRPRLTAISRIYGADSLLE